MYKSLQANYPVFSPDFNGTWIFSTYLQTILKYKSHRNHSSASRDVPCGRTDRHDEINSSFSKSCERVWKQILHSSNRNIRQSPWPRSLRCRSAAARLLRWWVRVPPGALMFVCCECCTLSGRGLCDELITRQEECGASFCVIYKPREWWGLDPLGAVAPPPPKAIFTTTLLSDNCRLIQSSESSSTGYRSFCSIHIFVRYRQLMHLYS